MWPLCDVRCALWIGNSVPPSAYLRKQSPERRRSVSLGAGGHCRGDAFRELWERTQGASSPESSPESPL